MSSKINLQTCEYARKSSIFQDNQLISCKELLDLRLPKVFLEFVIDSDFDSFQRNH